MILTRTPDPSQRCPKLYRTTTLHSFLNVVQMITIYYIVVQIPQECLHFEAE